MTIPDIGIEADVKLDIDGKDSKERQRANLQARQELETPRTLKGSFSLTAAAGATAATPINQLDGPSLGRRWQFRRFVADIANPVGAVEPGSITVFLFEDSGTGVLVPSSFSALNLNWKWTALPILQTWTQDQLTLDNPGKPIVVLVNGSAGAVTIGGQLQVLAEAIGTPERIYIE